MTACNLRLLSLDGGGVRGLATLFILRQILSHVESPKPCDYFDMIGGTSTGGLIAIMLGRLEMTVDQCIGAYIQLIDKVFVRTTSRYSSALHGVFGSVRSQYGTGTLETCIKGAIVDAGFDKEALMRGPKKSKCKTFVVSISREGRTSTLFTDYRPRITGEPFNFFNEVKIWEAARATCAATSFFDPINIVHGGIEMSFIDGGFDANNPIFTVLSQASEQFGHPIEPQIRSLLSLGTGRPPQGAFGKGLRDIASSIISIATNTQSVAKSFEDNHNGMIDRNAYFRFNPPDLFAEVGLDESKKRNIMAQRVLAYCQENDVLRKMETFGRSDSEGPLQEIAVRPIRQYRPPKRFYELTKSRQHVQPNNDNYWRHLTLESWKIYEAIYLAAKSRDGEVHYPSYEAQFRQHDPPRSVLKTLWRRVIRKQDANVSRTRLPKGLFMAVIYMLHIEKFFPNEQPVDERGSRGIVDEARYELLKRFGNWAPCQCGQTCGLEWTFGNDIGIYRGKIGKQKCSVSRHYLAGTLRQATLGKEGEQLFEATKSAWIETRCNKNW